MHYRVVIVGSGFGGLGMGIRLKQTNQDDFVILERAGDVGGVWRDNSYPGCACDVQSHLYSYSFAPNPNWSRTYSPSAEIHAYLKRCAERFGMTPRLRLNHEVREARWEEEAQRWRIETNQGVFTADILVAGVGALSEPSIPNIPGLSSFEGRVMHSARWDHSYALEGKRVAVIGTGASAIQFVPAIQPKVGQLKLFQRTAAWVVPRRDKAISPRAQAWFAKFPLLQRIARAWLYWPRELFVLGFRHPAFMRYLARLVKKYLAKQVRDRDLRAKLTPNYTFGCKRVLISDDYLPSLTKPNVEVITNGIREIKAHSVVTEDGAEHEVDAIILGTGFHVTDMPLAKYVRGLDGRTLEELWEGSPKAHLGTTVAGVPNMFMILGPNTGLGHSSVVTMMEAQYEHILKALQFMEAKAAATIEPRADVQAAFVAEMDAQTKNTVWNAGGCASWYLDKTGRNSTLWPTFTFVYRRRLERFEPSEYVTQPRRAAREQPAPAKRRSASCLEAAGTKVTLRRFDGMIHGFANMVGVSRACRAATIEIASLVRKQLDGGQS